MNRKTNTKSIVLSALLCALGIIIPMFSPIKLILEPASFTLASHVPTAIFVTLGATVGFLLGGFPIVVVFRALSHLIFVFIGSLYLKKHKNTIKSIKTSLGFSFIIGAIHALGEILVVLPFYFGNGLSSGYYEKGFITSVLMLVGIGTIIHSMLDFGLSVYIWNLMPKEVRKINDIKKTIKA